MGTQGSSRKVWAQAGCQAIADCFGLVMSLPLRIIVTIR